MPLCDNLTILSSLLAGGIADIAGITWCPMTRRAVGRMIAAQRIVRDMEDDAATELADRLAACDMAESDNIPF